MLMNMCGERGGGRTGQRELSDPEADLTGCTPAKVTNHPSFPGHFPVLAPEVLHLGKFLSPSNCDSWSPCTSPMGSSGAKIAQWGVLSQWKWPSPRSTTLLGYWLGPPKNRVISIATWFCHWAGTAQEEHDHSLKVEVDLEGADI